MNNLLEGKFKYFTQRELENGKEIPDELYKNIIPTAKVLDALREWYGKPIYVNSTYRSPEYNKAIGGATRSLHLEFNAIDFTILDKKDLPKLYNKLCTWDAGYNFNFLPQRGSMGLGHYHGRFIHIDTRKKLDRNAPARWTG